MNSCTFFGNFTEKPQVKTVNGANGETSVCTFRIGVNTRIGKDKTEVTFPTIEAWGPKADIIGKHFDKGEPIIVRTRLKTDQYNDKESGEKQYRDKYVLEDFTFVGGGKSKAQAQAQPAASPESEGNTKAKPKNGRTTREVAPVTVADDGEDDDGLVPF